MKKRTPAQQQYHELKQENPDSLLLFRMGDFYETFHEDAHIAHKVLGITLTARDKKSAHPIPMAGIPHHALEKYLSRLINAGYKVALAEQVGEVVAGTVVRREVTQHITPGTRSGSDDPVREIIGIWSDGEKYWTINGDSTVGTYNIGSCDDIEALFQRLMSMEPHEIVLDIQLPNKHEIERWANQVKGLVVSVSDVPSYPYEYVQSLTQTDTLEGYGEALAGGGVHVAGLLFQYLCQIQGVCLIQRIGSRSTTTSVQLDPLTIRNLEIFQSQYEGKKEHSLLAVIDKCSSTLGSRYLSTLLRAPTRDTHLLNIMHDRVALWSQKNERSRIRGLLNKLTDIVKIPGKLQRGHGAQHLLLEIKNNAEQVLLDPQVISLIHLSQDLLSWLEQLVASINTEDDRFFVYGFNDELDILYDLTQDSDTKLLAYHQKVVAHSGISGVRVKYTGTQGYCLETSKKDAKQFIKSSILNDHHYGFYPRQSLKSAERFSSPYLAELEQSIYQAQENYQSCFQKCIQKLSDQFIAFQVERFSLCEVLAQHDVASMSALLIEEFNRVLPNFSNQGVLSIKGGRHCVVEKFLSHAQQFIPNDLEMSNDDSFHLITGPNMGGKSTYLRQNALIVLLGHVGLPVPALQATLPLVDGIYARVGSGDALAKNQSTFMTEMIEMATIINNATKKSFIVLDELGRGTSTYDGMALAHALSVAISKIGTKTLFATHYHELIELEKTLTTLSNRQVSVVETDRDIVFMRKIISGGADKSYGLHVARRAGIPENIVDKAQQKLDELLAKHDTQVPYQKALFESKSNASDELQTKKEACFEALIDTDIDEMTPIDALVRLHQLKKQFLQITSTDS